MDVFDWIIVVAVLSAIGSALWWVAVIWLAVKAAKIATSQLDTQFVDLNRLIEQLAKAQGSQRTVLTGQIQSKWFAAQNEMRQLDDLRRQQSELNAASIRSSAASNGLFL